MEVVPAGIVSEVHQLHDLGLAAHGCPWLSPGHNFRQSGQVGLDFPTPLCPAGREPKPGNDLVHNEHSVMFGGDLPEVLQESGVLQGERSIMGPVGLHYHGGYVILL